MEPAKRRKTQSSMLQYFSMPQSDSGTVNFGNISHTISQVQDQSTELSSVIAENQGKSVVNEQLTDYGGDDSDKPVAVVANNDPSKSTASSNDVGFIIKKVINKEVVTDEERRMFLENRWTPHSKSDLPFSVQGGTKKIFRFALFGAIPLASCLQNGRFTRSLVFVVCPFFSLPK